MVEAPLFEDAARVSRADRRALLRESRDDRAAGGDTKLFRGEVRKVHFDPSPLGITLLQPGEPWAVLTLPALAHFFRLTDVRAPLADFCAAAL